MNASPDAPPADTNPAPGPEVRVADFELAESPRGRLASFDADAAQARAVAGLGADARLSIDGADLLACDGRCAPLRLLGAAAAIQAWAEAGLPVHLLAFPKDAPPLARLLPWLRVSDRRP